MQDTRLGMGYTSVEVQSVYSTAPADLAKSWWTFTKTEMF